MRSSDQTAPTPEGIASLVERGLVSPQDADLMRQGLALQGKLPAGYAVSGYSDPWFIVVKSWDGKPIAGDVGRELTSALTGLEVRGPRFEDGSLVWAVQALTPEAEAEKPASTSEPVPETPRRVETPAPTGRRPTGGSGDDGC